MEELLSLYFHIPFCQKRCGYCDFVTFAGIEQFIDQYLDALCKEIVFYGKQLAVRNLVHTIYIGGGTPSLLTAGQVTRILNETSRSFNLVDDAEVTIEANPGTLSDEKLKGYRNAGVNRISFGMQSARNSELVFLDRIHDYNQVVISIDQAKNSGFKNISVDLIYGLPGQAISDWEETLDQVVSLNVQHISCYSLTIEDGTPLSHLVKTGKINPLDEDLVGDMYELADQFLEKNGFEHYEISNWASMQGKFRSKHNIQYWLNEPYLGIGVGAHGYYDRLRIVNTKDIQDYISRINNYTVNVDKSAVSPAVIETVMVSDGEQMMDEMMLGFRLLKDGINIDKFKQKFGNSPEQVFEKELKKLSQNHLVKHLSDPDRYILTKWGMMLANQVFMEFVGES